MPLFLISMKQLTIHLKNFLLSADMYEINHFLLLFQYQVCKTVCCTQIIYGSLNKLYIFEGI